MNRTTMLATLREVLNDASTSFNSWSDARLLMYLSEGQDKFCEETGYFRDASSFTLTLESGTATYAVPSRIIELIGIYNGTKPLTKMVTNGVYGVDESVTEFDFSSSVPGMPTHWQTEVETGSINLYPTPGDDQDGESLSLRVWRYSLYDLAGDGPTEDIPAEPEIPARFHGAPIEWAAYRALMHHDEETQDPVKAAEHLNAFMKVYVADGRTAFNRAHNVEVRFVPNSAYRA